MSPARWRQFGCNLARVRPISTCCVLRTACCVLRAACCCGAVWRSLWHTLHSALCPRTGLAVHASGRRHLRDAGSHFVALVDLIMSQRSGVARAVHTRPAAMADLPTYDGPPLRFWNNLKTHNGAST